MNRRRDTDTCRDTDARRDTCVRFAAASGGRSPRRGGGLVGDRRVLHTSAKRGAGTGTTIEREPSADTLLAAERPWLVVVWNDPINLMTYVTYVLQKLFGYSREKATKLMLDVHHKGRAVVASGPRERAENDVSRLHRCGLWATLEQPE